MLIISWPTKNRLNQSVFGRFFTSCQSTVKIGLSHPTESYPVSVQIRETFSQPVRVMWSLENRPVTPQQPATFFLREVFVEFHYPGPVSRLQNAVLTCTFTKLWKQNQHTAVNKAKAGNFLWYEIFLWLIYKKFWLVILINHFPCYPIWNVTISNCKNGKSYVCKL